MYENDENLVYLVVVYVRLTLIILGVEPNELYREGAELT